MADTTLFRRAPTLAGFTSAVSDAVGVELRTLAPMTTLLVQTCNTRYRIVVSAGDAVLVEGGAFFPVRTAARLTGATVGGSFLKVGWIVVGLRMEIVVGDRRIVTSPVRDIAQEAEGPEGRVH